MWRRVDLLYTDVSDEDGAFIFRVEIMQVMRSRLQTHYTSESMRTLEGWRWAVGGMVGEDSHIPEDGILKD
jgi:hypothetical protein